MIPCDNLTKLQLTLNINLRALFVCLSLNNKPNNYEKYFLLTLILFFSISLSGQDKVVLRQTFIKLNLVIIMLKTAKTKFGKMAQKN